jgi:hypothetical protein
MQPIEFIVVVPLDRFQLQQPLLQLPLPEDSNKILKILGMD